MAVIARRNSDAGTIKMMKIITYSLTLLILVSCASKKTPPHYTVGISLTESAYDYAMQGQRELAEFSYNRAINKFKDMGNFCDMARVAIVMHSVSKNIQLSTLGEAAVFATLGECYEEINIINYLNDYSYDEDRLAEPYKTYALSEKTQNIRGLVRLTKDADTSDRTKSISYRMIAEILLSKSEYIEAVSYIEYAKEIDSNYAWTSNLLEDERLLLKAYKQMNIDTAIVEERIKVLEDAVLKKF